jgi:cell division protein FtsQ
VQKFTGSGKRAALLDGEESGDSFRLESLAIPHPILEDATGEETREGRDASFSRARERLPARRRSRSRFAWKSRGVQIAAALGLLATLGILYAIAWQTEAVLRHNPHFVLTSSKNVLVTGNRVVSSRQALAVFSPDIKRSIFRVPLATRQQQLQGIDWVRSATVMRLWPNHLRVALVERTPVAFVRDGDFIRLVDQQGVLLDLPKSAPQQYSFPVLTGISNSDPASTRAARMQTYREFMNALDANGGHFSAAVSEVDLSDPEDLRAVFTDGDRHPVVHLGSKDFLARYRAYQSHLAEWLQQYPRLRSVDMRYGKQIVLDTGTQANSSGDASAATVTGGLSPEGAQPTSAATKPKPGRKVLNAGSKPAGLPAARKTGGHASHPAARKRSRRHRHAPDRGHPVHNSIAHVVNGA